MGQGATVAGTFSGPKSGLGFRVSGLGFRVYRDLAFLWVILGFFGIWCLFEQGAS